MNTARNSRTEFNIRLLFGTNGLPLYVYDTETTGKDPEKDKIVQLSAIRYIVQDGKLVENGTMNRYINPEMEMSDKVISIHGITNEFAAEQMTEEEQFRDIAEFFGEHPIVCGHNVSFDNTFMRKLYGRHGKQFVPRVSIDTVDCARDNISYKEIKDYKLQTILETLGLDTGLKFHDSMDDVRGAALLLEAMYNEYTCPEKKTGPHVNKINIRFIKFMKGFNSEQRGIWVWSYDDEKIWYSTRYKCWMSANTDLSYVDIDDLEQKVLSMLGTDLEGLGKMNEKVFESKCKPGRTTISCYQKHG